MHVFKPFEASSLVFTILTPPQADEIQEPDPVERLEGATDDEAEGDLKDQIHPTDEDATEDPANEEAADPKADVPPAAEVQPQDHGEQLQPQASSAHA